MGWRERWRKKWGGAGLGRVEEWYGMSSRGGGGVVERWWRDGEKGGVRSGWIGERNGEK